MPKPFKEIAVREIAHAKQVIEWMDSGEWEEDPDLRRHYTGVIKDMEQKLGQAGER